MTTAATEALAAARASGRKLPEFFIVGQPKSGTTALYEMLRSHPGIYMPELKETRDHIDAVDRDIVRLLARRTQLARRAADAKMKLGAPVLDAGREAEVMRARRDWAAEVKLDPDAVADVFLDIIKMARRAQRG